MKSFFQFGWLSVLLLGVFACLAVSCSDDNPPVTPPAIHVDQNEISVGGAGGKVTIICQIEHARPSVSAEAKADQSWVSQFASNEKGEVTCFVDPNATGAERSAVITLNYTGAEAVSVKLVQAAAGELFTISELATSESRLKAEVKPLDPKMSYLVMILPKSEADAYNGDDDAMYNDDVKFLKDRAEKLGVTFERAIEVFSHKGAAVLEWEDLAVSTPYCIYAYGVTPKGERITPIVRAIMTTTAPTGLDTKFDINYQVNGVEVQMEVTPDNDMNRYYYDILSADLSTEEILNTVANQLNEIIAFYAQYGYTREQTVEVITEKGPSSFLYNNLEFATPYKGFALSVSPSGMLSGNPTIKEVTTGDVLLSDNQLTVEVSNITSRSADLKVTPSNHDSYVVTYAPFDYYGDKDDEVVKGTLSQYIRQGAITAGTEKVEIPLTALTPNTKYEILTMGVNGSYASTDLVRYTFQTPEASESDVDVVVKCDKYFAGEDAAKKFPGFFDNYRQYAILPVEVSTTTGDKVYYNIYEDDYTNRDEFTEDVLINDLMSRRTQPRTDFFCTYGKVLTLAAVAADANGNFGTTYRKSIRLSRDGVSPIDEYDFKPEGKSIRAFSSPFMPQNIDKRVVQLAPMKDNCGVQFKHKSMLLESLKNTQIKPFKKNIMRRSLPKTIVSSKQD